MCVPKMAPLQSHPWQNTSTCLVLPASQYGSPAIPDAELRSIFEANCVGSWPLSVCYVANAFGLASTVLWFTVLLPQVLKNWCRRSVHGLSFLWGLANFTASLVNVFFIFNLALPLYVRVQGVYQPVLELAILSQFLLFYKELFRRKLLILLFCFLLWGTIVELELNIAGVYVHLEWISIVLWSIETFPQIFLNLNLRSTSGQSTLSVLITICGKTSDFLSTYGLALPPQYVIMAYFSSTAGLINGFQLFWYNRKVWINDGCFTCRKPQLCCTTQKVIETNSRQINTAKIGSNGEFVYDEHAPEVEEKEALLPSGSGELLAHPSSINCTDPNSYLNGSYQPEAPTETGSLSDLPGIISEAELHSVAEHHGDGQVLTAEPKDDSSDDQVSALSLRVDEDRGARGYKKTCRKICITIMCIGGMLYCGLAVCFFAVAFYWKTQSLWTLLGPASCIFILSSAYAYRFLKEKANLGKVSCYKIISQKLKTLWFYL